jgi:small subunit ribosomal protein S15
MPSWCSYRPEEVEALVIKLAKEGNSADKIGNIMRDKYGIPLVKPITGKKISRIIKEANLTSKIPEDLAALTRKASRMRRHLEKNRADFRSKHNMQLLESRIHRLTKFYKEKGLLPEDWKYQPLVGQFI